MFQLFDDVIGHTAILDMLSRVITHPGQAYLFHGPQGVGKGMVAERFAAGLLFSSEEQSQLDRSTLSSHLFSHPDYLVVTREDGAREITIRQARELAKRVAMSSARGGRTVIIIQEADTLNEEACNALLKTIEEPASSLVFIFLAERPDRLPGTLRSRLAPVPFNRVKTTEIVPWLKEKYQVEHPETFAVSLHGCPGRTIQALENLSSWNEAEGRVRAIAERLLHGDLGSRLAAIEQLSQQADRTEDVSRAWYDLLERCQYAISEEWTSHPEDTLRMARGLIHAWKLVGGSLSPRFALEWNGTLPFVPNHSLPRPLDSTLFSSL